MKKFERIKKIIIKVSQNFTFDRHINIFDLDPNAEVDENGIFTVDEKGSRKYLVKKRSNSSAGGV